MRLLHTIKISTFGKTSKKKHAEEEVMRHDVLFFYILYVLYILFFIFLDVQPKICLDSLCLINLHVVHLAYIGT